MEAGHAYTFFFFWWREWRRTAGGLFAGQVVVGIRTRASVRVLAHPSPIQGLGLSLVLYIEYHSSGHSRSRSSFLISTMSTVLHTYGSRQKDRCNHDDKTY